MATAAASVGMTIAIAFAGLEPASTSAHEGGKMKGSVGEREKI